MTKTFVDAKVNTKAFVDAKVNTKEFVRIENTELNNLINKGNSMYNRLYSVEYLLISLTIVYFLLIIIIFFFNNYIILGIILSVHIVCSLVVIKVIRW